MIDIFKLNKDLAELTYTLSTKYTDQTFADNLDQIAMDRVELHLKYVDVAITEINNAIDEMEGEYRG